MNLTRKSAQKFRIPFGKTFCFRFYVRLIDSRRSYLCKIYDSTKKKSKKNLIIFSTKKCGAVKGY